MPLFIQQIERLGIQTWLTNGLAERNKKLSTSYPPLIHQVIHHLVIIANRYLDELKGQPGPSYPPKNASPIIIISINIYINIIIRAPLQT